MFFFRSNNPFAESTLIALRNYLDINNNWINTCLYFIVVIHYTFIVLIFTKLKSLRFENILDASRYFFFLEANFKIRKLVVYSTSFFVEFFASYQRVSYYYGLFVCLFDRYLFRLVI